MEDSSQARFDDPTLNLLKNNSVEVNILYNHRGDIVGAYDSIIDRFKVLPWTATTFKKTGYEEDSTKFFLAMTSASRSY